jgi:hypothetical protein
VTSEPSGCPGCPGPRVPHQHYATGGIDAVRAAQLRPAVPRFVPGRQAMPKRPDYVPNEGHYVRPAGENASRRRRSRWRLAWNILCGLVLLVLLWAILAWALQEIGTITPGPAPAPVVTPATYGPAR